MINEKLFAELINDQINDNGVKNARTTKYFNYYRGDHDILKKEAAGTGKPDNRLVFNYAELIIDTNHSYLFSKPYSMDIKNKGGVIQRILGRNDLEKFTEDFIAEVKGVYFENTEENTTSTHGKVSGISGESIELHYIDTMGNIRFTETDPREWCFFTYEGIEYALRHFKTYQYVPTPNNRGYEKKRIEKAELYNAFSIFNWEKDETGWILKSETPHLYGEVPVIVFHNKESIDPHKDSTSDLKNIVNLIDAYNQTVSSLLNTLEYSGDPYMVLKEFGLDEDGIEKIKTSRIIEMYGEHSDIKFLQWDHNIEAYKEALELLERLIFVLSFTPNLFDNQSLTADSGIALKLKFMSADLKGNQKERSFVKGLQKRLRLIARQLEAKTPSKPYYTNRIYQNIDITFNRNMPQNLKEISEIVSNLAGSVSDETRIKLLPFVSNAKEELEKMKEQENAMSSLFTETGVGTNGNTTGN